MEYATRESISRDLRDAGVRSGGVVIVHSSYKSLGFVVGGPQAVVEALIDVAGTVVVPTHTSENSDPAAWVNPPVPVQWHDAIRHEAPGFDRERTPVSRWMGRIAELVRTWPGAMRSDHPECSFAAVGPDAAQIVAEHQLEDGLGARSPLGAINRLDGQILLLGVGHDSNTSLHMGEFLLPDPPRRDTGGSVRQPDGSSRWITWSEPVADSDDFEQLGAAFEATGAVTVATVAAATVRVMSQRAAVAFAKAWIPINRKGWDR